MSDSRTASNNTAHLGIYHECFELTGIAAVRYFKKNTTQHTQIAIGTKSGKASSLPIETCQTVLEKLEYQFNLLYPEDEMHYCISLILGGTIITVSKGKGTIYSVSMNTNQNLEIDRLSEHELSIMEISIDAGGKYLLLNTSEELNPATLSLDALKSFFSSAPNESLESLTKAFIAREASHKTTNEFSIIVTPITPEEDTIQYAAIYVNATNPNLCAKFARDFTKKLKEKLGQKLEDHAQKTKLASLSAMDLFVVWQQARTVLLQGTALKGAQKTARHDYRFCRPHVIKLAEEGHAEAQYALARDKLKRETQSDLQAYEYWLHCAANNRHLRAHLDLIVFYTDEVSSTPLHTKMVIRYTQRLQRLLATHPHAELHHELQELIASNATLSHILHAHKTEQALRSHTVLEDHIDIHQFPSPDLMLPLRHEATLILGDLQSNVLTLLHTLIRHHIISISPAEYLELTSIYVKSHHISNLTKEDLTRFRHIIANVKIQSGPCIRLLGDELADRGQLCLWVILFIKKIVVDGAAIKINLSNHSMEFIGIIERGLLAKPNTNGYYPYYTSLYGSDTSLQNMGILIRDQLITAEEIAEIEAIYEQYYRPLLHLFTYCVDHETKQFYFCVHGTVGLESVRDNAEFFKLDCQINTLTGLINTIDAINAAFRNLAQTGKIYETAHPPSLPHQPNTHPIYRLIWNRFYLGAEMPIELDGYKMIYVHGHDGFGKVPKEKEAYVINLDNKFGRTVTEHQGEHKTLCFEAKPRPEATLATAQASAPQETRCPISKIVT